MAVISLATEVGNHCSSKLAQVRWGVTVMVGGSSFLSCYVIVRASSELALYCAVDKCIFGPSRQMVLNIFQLLLLSENRDL
jgi:hypothetical protein